MKINEVIEMAKKNMSLDGVVIDDLGCTQVKVKDALLLADKGIVVPEHNLYYDDSEITYDPDFDEVQWSKEPIKMTWEQKSELFEGGTEPALEENTLTIDIKFKDKETSE